MQLAAFLLLALAAVLSAVLVVTHRNPVISAMALAVNLLAISGFYFLLSAEFLGLLQVIVYAGAILVLILFVIMLLNLPNELRGKPTGILQKSIGSFLGLMFLILIAKTVLKWPGRFSAVEPEFGSVESVGRALFTRYYYPFEVISLLLVVAMVGAVLLAKRKL